MMSPAVMYSFALSTFAVNFSFVTFDANGICGASRGNVIGTCSVGCSSNATSRSISATAFSYASVGLAASSITAFTRIVIVCYTRSKISSSSAIRKYSVGVCRSSCGGRGTIGSMS